MKNKNNSPLNQDVKFDTSLQPSATNPKELIKMTPKQRSEARKSLSDAVVTGLTFTPLGGALGVAGKAVKVIKSNIGGGAHAIGQGLVRKFGTKGMKKTYDMFANTAKQFRTRGAASQQTTRAEHIIPKGNKAVPKVKTMADLTPKVKTYDMKVIGQQSAPKVKASGMNKPVAKPKTKAELLKEREILNQRPSQQYSLPKIVEGGVELGRGDLKRRGITPGPYGGYYKRTPAGKSFRHPWSM